jgi:DNA repair protein RadC
MSATEIATKALVIKDMPADLRPDYRARMVGMAGLSNYELMQLVYSFKAMDTAVELMRKADGRLSNLFAMTLDEMQEVQGVGPKAALAIQAAIELGRRAARETLDRLQIRSPADVADLLMLEMSLLEQEHMRVVILDTKNNVIAVDEVYKGSLNTAVVRIGEVFRAAIRRNACSIIVTHNHPSGDPTPSPEDVRVTEMLVEAGKLLDIAVLDHIVIGRNRFVSLKERGLGFS